MTKEKADKASEKELLLESLLQEAKQRLTPAQREEDEARIICEQLMAKQAAAYKLEQICAQMADLAQQPSLTDKSPITGQMLEDANAVNQHYAGFIDRINRQITEFKAR